VTEAGRTEQDVVHTPTNELHATSWHASDICLGLY